MESPNGTAPTDAQREQASLDLGVVDGIFAFLTLPALLFALMFLTSEQGRRLASKRARIKLYVMLLGVEALVAGGVVWLVVR